MNDEFIMFNNEAESYQESYESDESVTLEDVEAYLESLSTDIDEAEALRDDMIQEEYEYEDLTLEDVEMFIESAVDKYNNIVDTVNGIVQEAAETTDNSGVDDFEEAGDIDDFEIFGKGSPWDPRRKYKIKVDEKRFKEDDKLRRKRRDNNDYVDDIDTLPSRDYIKAKELRGHYSKDPRRNKAMLSMIDQNMKDIVTDARKARKANDHVKEYALTNYRDNELDLEFEEPLTAYEFFDESYEPDNEPFVPYTDEGIYIEADGPEKHDLTVGGAIVLGAGLGAAIGTGINIINMLITEHKFGRFPHDMKRVYDIVQKADFKASANKRVLKKALKAVSKDLRWMFNGIGGRWKVTVNEAAELKKLRKHVDDLYTRGWMLTRNEELSQKRRVPERIAEFVEQGNKVLKILNKTVYKNPAEDVTTEYMV